MNQLIKPDKVLGYSDIYLDFLHKSNGVGQFYPAKSLFSVIKEIDTKAYPREEIADILVKQNKVFGSGEAVFENIERLRRPDSLVVITGQQAGLFGGSMLIIIKALAVVKAAKEYSEQLNRPVVPVFWIAGDDHDYEEVNHTYVLDRSSQIVRIQYEDTPEIELPTAQLKFTNVASLQAAKEALKASLGETDFTTELYDLIDDCYTSNDSYVTGFAKMMARLTENYGLVLFSPGDKEVKKLSENLFHAFIDKQTEMHAALNETNERIRKQGYHIQVEKKNNSAHLFFNLPGRTPVLEDRGEFRVADKNFSHKDISDAIKTSPENFSPDVMTRPILQSSLFPVLSQKGGAAEIAYLAQIHRLFDLFSLPVPLYKARPTATIIESRFKKMMEEHEIQFEELLGDIEQVINRVMAKSFPDDIEERFKVLRNHIKCHFEDFSEASLKFDPGLENFAQQVYGKINFNLKAFEGKVFGSHKKKSKEQRERIYRLWHALYPNRNFQERVLNISYFIAKYGFTFMDFLYEQIESEENAHQLIFLTEFNK